MKDAKYFYKCDQCGLSKEVDFKDWGEHDEARREMLKDGWIMGFEMSAEIWCGNGKKGCVSSGSFNIRGEYCSDKCLIERVKYLIKQRRKT